MASHLRLRKKGGFAFIHNDSCFSEQNPWLNIWIEKIGVPAIDSDERIYKSLPLPLYKRFVHLSSEWTRYVEVEIRNESMKLGPLFKSLAENFPFRTPEHMLFCVGEKFRIFPH